MAHAALVNHTLQSQIGRREIFPIPTYVTQSTAAIVSPGINIFESLSSPDGVVTFHGLIFNNWNRNLTKSSPFGREQFIVIADNWMDILEQIRENYNFIKSINTF